jgi:hypothetical protein
LQNPDLALQLFSLQTADGLLLIYLRGVLSHTGAVLWAETTGAEFSSFPLQSKLLSGPKSTPKN